MPKKLTILGALTAALVFGYMGLFAGSNAQAGGQTFVGNNPATVASSIDVDYCYVNQQVQVAAPGGALLPTRLGCNNPASLPVGTAVSAWTIINLPVGNRLTLPATFTPSGANEWSSASVACLPVNADNECTAATLTGDISSRTDIGCNSPAFEILGKSGGLPGPSQAPWGGQTDEAEGWPTPDFTRLAASVADGGNGPIDPGTLNGYIHEVNPFPPTWTFRTADLAELDTLYIPSGVGIPIPVTKLNLTAYESNYAGQTGLIASVALLGGSPDTPPNDSQTVCALQSPQDSFSESDVFITPAVARRIVRWTILQSDYDRADATGPNFEDDDLTRILDWQCDIIGVPTDGGDADGDCDPDPTDANDGNIDNDGDLVPDGVEREYNSDPNDVDKDTDNDGCDDYCEIFQYSDPNDTDTDNDGQADKPDDIPTNCAAGGPAFCGGDDAPTTGSDALNLTDDNCPVNANPSQLNTDSMFQFHGMGTGTGDATNPDEDVDGDACDTDADNDGLPGATEPLTRISAWGAYNGADGNPTSVCVGIAAPSAIVPDEPLLDTRGDTDQDYVLDGLECQFRSRPDQSIRGECPIGSFPSTGTCAGAARNCNIALPVGMTDDEGCAQPQNPSGVQDGGGSTTDGLYMPGANTNPGIESQFRSQTFNQASGTPLMDVDGDTVGITCGPTGSGECDRDSDRDTMGFTGGAVGLQDGVEVWVFGTFPADTDSDQDGCPDADEVTDINGDGTNSSGDSGLFASRVVALGSPLDNNNDGRVDDYALGVNTDVNKNNLYLLNSGDQGFMGGTQVSPGSCQVAGAFVEDNVDVTSLLNLP